MNPVKKRAPYNVTTIETRCNIKKMYNNGVSKANIVRNLQIPKSIPFQVQYENSQVQYENSQVQYENSQVQYENSQVQYENSQVQYNNS